MAIVDKHGGRVAPCLGPYGDFRGVGVSYERGTPVRGTVSPGYSGLIEASGEVPRGEKMLYSETEPESYITEYALLHKDT